MIYFQKLRYQNILSTGNVFTEIDFTKSKTTLIVGENGAGKSTLIDALCYVLYGKPFRNINKPQLINSITQKNLLVEVDFTIGKKQYTIKRGMRPNIFEVYVNGSLINQNAGMADYQEMLERNIIKMNYKSFKQIIVLGSANYIPFMQLSAADRRHVIGDFLDIEIFTTMSQIAKERLNANKTQIRELEYNIDLIEQKIELTEKHILALKTNNQGLVNKKKELILETEDKVEGIALAIQELNQQVTDLSETIIDADKIQSRRAKLIDLEGKYEQKIKSIKREVQFFGEHNNCPTCKQGIEHDFKLERIDKKNTQLEELNTNLNKIEADILLLDDRIVAIAEVNSTISEQNRLIQNNNAELMALNNSLVLLRKEVEELQSNTTHIEASTDEIKILRSQLKSTQNDKELLFKQKEVLDVAATLLKDGGIKTRIIRQFVPVINKLINKYLAALDFFVNFELDEQFNETIKSRFRDEFSYASFSEGEKAKIDLALMLTWRAVAKLRNSASTNLLIFDEVFDGSLDNNGVENLLGIFQNQLGSDVNIFVISHKGDSLFDKFDTVLKFIKHGNFSKIEINK
jgi:DNA repair exonuclease SbcCD ATPase subunit